MRTHAEWNKHAAKFAATASVPCLDCGTLLPAGDDAARQAHYAQCSGAVQQKRLAELEVVIERGLQTFFEVGAALLEIRDKRLYQPAHKTFEDYCRVRWNMSRRNADRLIEASEVVENLRPIGLIPQNEAQAREFNGLAPDEQKALAALSKAVLGDKPTASGIRELKELSQSLLASGAITVDGDSVSLSDVLDYSLTEIQHERLLRGKQAIADEKAARRSKKVAEINAQEIPTLDSVPHKFAVIYADPPWRYDYSLSDSRAIENQYPTMEVEAICALPVSGICTDDAVLFLWVTSPKLAEGMRVVEAWDFQYKTCMVWDKERVGMGYYARQQHELLLIATRGNMPAPEPAVRPASVIRIERSETHSQKPAEFRRLIETMYPEFQRIELFARSTPENWYAWGNEVI